jgi:protein tyrosine/serine phosphatase
MKDRTQELKVRLMITTLVAVRPQLTRWTRRTGVCLGLVATLALGWAGYLRATGNFHAVEEGVLYRSAQLDGHDFKDRIRTHGIRTVINLRGENARRQWYVDEMKAASDTWVRHIDFPLSASQELTDVQVRQLLSMLRDSPTPILIHCQGGADRSGLASALYKLVIARRSKAEAASQLSFRYGHFPWLGSGTDAMDRTFERVSGKLMTLDGQSSE